MNYPYQILELESLLIFYNRWDEKPRRAVLASVLDEMVPLSLSAVNSHTFDFEVAMNWIRIEALHVDVNDVLPPNGAQILV